MQIALPEGECEVELLFSSCFVFCVIFFTRICIFYAFLVLFLLLCKCFHGFTAFCIYVVKIKISVYLRSL